MFIIIDPSPYATIQDLGRLGYGRFGMPTAGAMDSFALRAANLLVGNVESAAGLEVGLGDLTLMATEDCVVAVAGAGYDLWVQGRPLPLWLAIMLRRGWELALRKGPGGCWAYLAVAGGLQCPAVLGSRATYVRGNLGGLGGGPLRGGDVLPVGVPSQSLWELAGRELPQEHRPVYAEAIGVEVVLGPQADHFTEAGLHTFLSSEYRVSEVSDRMGYRLRGPAVERQGEADIVSDGMVTGSVQVPASGQPMVMLADGPPTGGYPKIATVVSADLPLLAQCAPGAGRVRFRETPVAAAQARYRGMMRQLRNGVREVERFEIYSL